MPAKLKSCVKQVMDEGKTEQQAYAICNASINKTFSDRISFDKTSKSLISVRDGVLEYYGSELGMQPEEKVFKVYRSPATIANISPHLSGIPLTDEHVEVGSDITSPVGSIKDSLMVDLFDMDFNSTLGIKNTVDLDSKMLSRLEEGKRELSLGYSGDLIPHDKYDFEQVNLIPHHLAVVPAGRCGSACSFIDKTKEGSNMKLNKAFLDAEGQINLQQVVEIAMQLPDALKNIPMDKLTEVLPVLQEVVAMGNNGDKSTENDEGDVVAKKDGDGDNSNNSLNQDPEKTGDALSNNSDKVNDQDMSNEEDKKSNFADSKKFKDAVAVAAKKAKQEHAKVIQKAIGFVDADYTFEDKETNEIMRDAIAVQTDQEFSDEELPIAFKMLTKTSKYVNFGDSKEVDNSLSARIEKSLEG